MKHFLHLAFFALLLAGKMSIAQTSNLGFESGNFTGWQGATGHCCPVFTPLPGLNTAQYAITSGTATDIFSNGLLPVVAPGSLHSARLGNELGSAESERLMRTFICPSDSLLLILRYAVVLENANHPEPKQPRFGFQVSIGNNIDVCNSKTVVAGEPGHDFITIGTFDILPWQSKVIDLKGHQGDTIEIVFETGDCEPGGHFGYAYVDCELAEIPEVNGCNNDGSIILFAPENLNCEWWDGSTADSVYIASPQNIYPYTLQLNPNTGCEVTIEFNPGDLLPDAGFSSLNNCDLSVNFIINDFIPGVVYEWDYGDGSFFTGTNPVYSYSLQGNYQVTLIATAQNNCKNESDELIHAMLSPVAGFSLESPCPGIPVKPANNSECPVPPCQYSWLGNGVSPKPVFEPELIFSSPGNHELTLIVTSGNICSDTFNVVIPVKEGIECDGEINSIFVPTAFSPNGDGINDYFNISGKSTGFEIYTRWGFKVFSGKSASAGWNGTYNEIICPEGIYIVIITGNNIPVREKTRLISLVR